MISIWILILINFIYSLFNLTNLVLPIILPQLLHMFLRFSIASSSHADSISQLFLVDSSHWCLICWPESKLQFLTVPFHPTITSTLPLQFQFYLCQKNLLQRSGHLCLDRNVSTRVSIFLNHLLGPAPSV